MSSQHPKHPSQPAQPESGTRDKSELLDELESIKGLLEDELDAEQLDEDLDIDVPILDDVVAGEEALNSGAGGDLLDLRAIFGDEEQPPGLSANDLEADADIDFEGLDADVEIPVFKLAISEQAEVTPEPESSADAAPAPADAIADERATEMPSDSDSTDSVGAVSDITAATPDDIDIELVIQELVDEMIPQMEDRLRQRLSQYSEAAIRELAARHLNR